MYYIERQDGLWDDLVPDIEWKFCMGGAYAGG